MEKHVREIIISAPAKHSEFNSFWVASHVKQQAMFSVRLWFAARPSQWHNHHNVCIVYIHDRRLCVYECIQC